MTESERALVERAMRGVRVVVCSECNGLGAIGAPTLRITCPTCRGCGETTAHRRPRHNERTGGAA